MTTYLILLLRGSTVEWYARIDLEYEPEYFFHDDGVYELEGINRVNATLTYQYQGNALAV